MELLEILKWGASISGIVAAFMVSLDSGRRVTGWGFALFVFSSILWISGSLLDSDEPVLSEPGPVRHQHLRRLSLSDTEETC